MLVSLKRMKVLLLQLLPGRSFPPIYHSDDFINKIQNSSEFRKLIGDQLSAKDGQVKAVRVVYLFED
jgi:hypothetical protein